MAQQMEMTCVEEELPVRSHREEKAEKEADNENDETFLSEGPPLSDAALQMSTKSLPTLRSMLSVGASDLERAQEMLNTALGKFSRYTARSNYSTEQGYAASFEEARKPLRKTAEEAAALADSVYQTVRLIDEGTGDRPSTLSEVDLSRANAKAHFIKEDVSENRLEDLQKAMARSLAENDIAACWLYVRYVPARLQENRVSDVPGSSTRLAVATLFKSMQTRLTDTRGREVNAAAKDLRKKALDVKQAIYKSMNAGGHIPKTDRPSQFL